VVLLVTLLAPRVLTGYWKICVPLYITILHTPFYFIFLSSDRHINAWSLFLCTRTLCFDFNEKIYWFHHSYTNWQLKSFRQSVLSFWDFLYCKEIRMVGRGYLSRCYESLRAWRSRDRIPVGARFSASVQTCPGAPQPPTQWVPGLSWG